MAFLANIERLVSRGVVRIERQTTYTGGSGPRRMLNHGTGIVIGQSRINGREEYFVLTNEHVADNHHVSGASTLSICEGGGVRRPIPLVTVAVDYRRDQALLRTVDCDQTLFVSDLLIGPPLEQPSTAFTEGYGNGKFSTIECRIAPGMVRKWGVRSYQVDVPVGAGQSGAPLLAVADDGRLHLLALIFCGNDRRTEATPLYPGRGVLRQFAALAGAH